MATTYAGAYRFDLEEVGDLTGRSLRIAFNAKTTLTNFLVRLGDDFSNYNDFYFGAGIVPGVNLFEFDWDTPNGTVGAPSIEPTFFAVYAFVAAAGTTFVDGVSVDDFILISNLPTLPPCYNVRATCLDPAHFFTQKTTKTFRFSGEEAPIVTGAPGAPILQAIRSRGVKLIPTRIDLESGYGRRDLMQVSFTDFLDDDLQTDPYLSTRAMKPESTFFRKFVARNPYLKGRPLILREGLGIDDPMTGKVRINLDEFRTRRYVIDRVDGPNNQGVVTFVAKDILKALDVQKLPTPSDAKINDVNPMDTTQTVIELAEGSVDSLLAQWEASGVVLPSGLFFVRMDDELMLVLSAPAGGLFLTVIRAQLGSEAEEHDAKASVQFVQSWYNMRVDDIWYDIQIQSKVDPSLIGFSDVQAEIDFFIPEFVLTAHISEPQKASDIMKGLNLQSGVFTWWDAEDQLTRMKPIRPKLPGENVSEFTDVSSIVDKSVDIKRREELRITNAFVRFNPINWAAELDKAGNYKENVLYIDADAESEDEYNDQKNRTFLNYFFPDGSDTIARSVAARYVQKFRDPPKAVKCQVTTKDAAFVKPGDLVNINTYGLVDFDGRPIDQRMLVTAKRRLDAFGIKWEFELDEYQFVTGKFAFWAPDTAPDLPLATPADLQYAYWAGDDCLLPDGTDPYLWV